MPRIARAIVAGYPHHITQRGNYRQAIFESDADYQQYLKWLGEYCSKYALKLWAYCLMSNHVHFIGVPMYEDSLARTFNTLHMRYAQYVNQKRGANGHVWQVCVKWGQRPFVDFLVLNQRCTGKTGQYYKW